MKGHSKAATLCLALAMATLAVIAAGSSAAAGHGHHRHRAAVTVRLLHPDQASILRRGVLVRVTSRRAGAVKLKGTSSTFDDRSKPLTKNVVVRFRKPGSRVVKLALLRSARKAVGSCTGRTILLRAGNSRSKAAMVRDAKRCRVRPIEMKNAKNCDFIAEPGNALCMLPFPDDYYTVADSHAETGKRIEFRTAGMPANASGEHVDAAAYDVSDGFSQGATILVKIPGIETPADVAAMGAAPINAIDRYTQKNAPIVVIDTATGKRWPIWAEVDSNAQDQSKRLLEIHPATNFASGHRYVVAIRDVRNAAGKRIEAPIAFRYFRDDIPSRQRQINARRAHFTSIFKTLKAAGIRRDGLYLAWDFTVASDENNAHRMLAIRNDAFAKLGDTNLADGMPQGHSPAFTVTSVEDHPQVAGNPGAAEIARRVRGKLTVPCYLLPDCGNGGTFKLGSGDLPTQNGIYEANFDCIVPESVVTGPAASARLSLYGSQLGSDASEVTALAQSTLAQAHKLVLCSTDQIGMSKADQAGFIPVLTDLSKFPRVVDRLQQGMLDELYLGRAMISSGGFTSNDAFHQDGTALTPSVLDTSHLYYDGNSQGGIEGGALTAVSPDFTRAALGVPAMDYSALLPRSTDFDRLAQVLYPAYRDETARPLVLDLAQMLWDRGDPNGYAHRMTTDPLPNTPPHQVLLNAALGDFASSDYLAEVEARTIGASAHSPGLYNGRWPGMSYLWNLPAISTYPFTGSAIYYWDSGPIRPDPGDPTKSVGVGPPPLENAPNRTGENPHGLPRLAPAEQQLVSDFFEGAIQQRDNCGNGPCYDGVFTGP